MAEQSDEELLAELGVEVRADTPKACSPLEERMIAGFEDIQRFVDEHGRMPGYAPDGDIFERLYLVRLARLRDLSEWHGVLVPLDRQGLLSERTEPQTVVDDEDDAALLAALGVADDESGLTTLRHVRSAAEKKVAEEIAQRDPCPDFARFRPLFEQVQAELDTGVRETRPFGVKAEIVPGRFFVLNGQKVYVAEIGEMFRQEYGDNDARLRLIYDNGTQSDLLMRSLQRALTKDEAGRRITDPHAGPLFAARAEDGDTETGTIYVLRSLSDDPRIAERRDLLHKIGVTGGSVERRIANAKLDPTYLMAEVEIASTYKLLNVNRARLETLLHRVFAAARLDIEIRDRFDTPIMPREWFLVPLFVIDEAVERIRDGTIARLRYDPERAALVER